MISYLQLLQLWVEAGERHVSKVSTGGWVPLCQHYTPPLLPLSYPLAVILVLHLQNTEAD